jgi:hypothetical protein
VVRSNGCVDASGTDYSGTFEGGITEDRAVESAKFSRQSNFTGAPVQVCELAIGQLLAKRGNSRTIAAAEGPLSGLIGEKSKELKLENVY